MSNIANLVDEYEAAKAILADQTAIVEKLKEQILETNLDILIGTNVYLEIDLRERKNFNNKLAKKFLTDDQIKLCTEKSTVYTNISMDALSKLKKAA
jgi:hypothetical protein